MARIQTKLVKNLTDEEYQRCYSLNLRGEGEMRDQLRRLRNDPQARVYMLREQDQLIAWSLVFDKCAHFYTRRTHRRKGLGTRLVNRIHKDHNWPVVYAHDDASEGFFLTVKDKVRING